jgi:D-glycero-D-manno-heptose 1,7-bisphosphate phosphatase
MAVKALFLDRDGVINEDTGYVSHREHFRFIEGIVELCRTAMSKGYIIIVVTNQSGIERGYFTESDYRNLTEWMLTQFDAAGVRITEVLHCPLLSGQYRPPTPLY